MKLLIITNAESDLSELLQRASGSVTMSLAEASEADIGGFDAYCILGGTGEEPVALNADLRAKLEAQVTEGKRIFCEYAASFYGMYMNGLHESTHHRLICVDNEKIDGLARGDILDDENNTYFDMDCFYNDVEPILVYHDYIIAHAHTDMSREEITDKSVFGLWKRNNVLFTSFRLCNFNKARLAPRRAWEAVVKYIVKYLTGSCDIKMPAPVIQYGFEVSFGGDFDTARKNAARRALNWLDRNLLDDGINGICEGMSHRIQPDGVQIKCSCVRADCSGEASGAFLLDGIINKNSESKLKADKLEKFVFEKMLVNGGRYDGMLRWTETAWETCYGDDVSRAILSTLLDCDLTHKKRRENETVRILDFLNKTTAKNGIRTSRTDICFLENTDFAVLRENTDVKITAHHNGYYHAALALGSRIYNKPQWLETAEKGMQTMMSVYPDTYREHSETQEMCRLILPLAVLLDVTKKSVYGEMLYRVCDDLEKHRHPFGGYMEWDTGYKAHRSRLSKDECSLLAENGDPIADQLYSVNWLPIGFAYAYKATGDEAFYGKWRGIVEYFIKTQMYSADKNNDGAWTRAFDMNLREAYGVPHDVGWAAYCVESGWTVAEIAMGMQIMDLIKGEEV